MTETKKSTLPKWIKLNDPEQEQWAIGYLEKQLGQQWRQTSGLGLYLSATLVKIAENVENEKANNRARGTQEDFWQKLLKKMEASWRARISRKSNQKNLSVLLHQSLKQPLNQLCKQNQMSRSDLIEQLILDANAFRKTLEKQSKEQLKAEKEKHERRVTKEHSFENRDKAGRMKREVGRVQGLAQALEESIRRESQLEAFIEQNKLEEQLEQALQSKETGSRNPFQARSEQLFKDRLSPYQQTINDIQKNLEELGKTWRNGFQVED